MGIATSSHANVIQTNAHTLIGGRFKPFHLIHTLCEMRWAELNTTPPPPQPAPALVLPCIAYATYTTGGDMWCNTWGLYSAPCCPRLVCCWYSVTDISCPALNRTAGSARKNGMSSMKQGIPPNCFYCITISCNKWFNWWHEWCQTVMESLIVNKEA